MIHLSNATVKRSIAAFELLHRTVHQLPRDQELTSSFLGQIKIRPIVDVSSTSGVFSHQNFTLELISLANVPRTRATLCRRLFDLSQCMRCHDVSRAQNCDTEKSHKTEREERQQNRRLSAHQSATSATQDLGRFSILCDSQKHTTCLDTHHKACLKHTPSSMDPNQI